MSTSTCKTAAVMGLLSRSGPAQAPAAAGERTIETVTAEILEAKRAGGEAILAIGRGLIEAKEMLEHGAWIPWLNEKVEFSERTAQNFMRLARDWSNPQALADLGASKALVLLALPESEREAFLLETHETGGEEKTVFDMTERELKKALRDREEALADKDAAEQAQAQMAADMKLTRELLDRAQADAAQAGEHAAALERELAEFKARPVEVAVAEADPAQLERAKAEAVAEMQKKLDKARADKVRADEKRKDAEAALDETRRKLAGAVAGRQSAEKALAAAQTGPSPIAADSELAVFETYFNQAQEIANKMRGLLLKVRGREDGSTARKLEQALLALGEKIKEGAS